jgi:6-phosphogluconolactonase
MNSKRDSKRFSSFIGAAMTPQAKSGQQTAQKQDLYRVRLMTIATVFISFMIGSCGGGSSGAGIVPPPISPNPVPAISSLAPQSANAGGASFTLTVTGSGFVSSSSINWNGSALTTTEVSATELTTTVSAADIAAVGTAQIDVVNSTPGGGVSNSLSFTIEGAAIPGFVYVANGIGVSLTAGNISVFSVDPNTGVLTPVPGSPFNAGAQPTAVASDPSSRFLYETSNLGVITPSNNISAFTISPTTGALTPVPGSPFMGGIYPASISVDSTGSFVYTADSGGDSNGNSISGFSIDVASGALTPISQASCAAPPLDAVGLCNAVAADPVAGFLFGSNGFGYVSAFSITSQGRLNQVAGSPFLTTTNPLGGPREVAVESQGNFLYTANYYASDISGFSITPASGALNQVPGSPFVVGGNNAPSDLVADPLGRFLYVLDFNAGVSGFAINPSTGALTILPGFPIIVPVFSPTPLAIDPSGRFLYVGSGLSYQAPSVYAFAINASTGALTAVPGSPFTVDGTPLAITVTRKVP